MNVHIVCSDLDTDKILPRLMRLLAADAGWTISDTPSPYADLNYFSVYIEYAQRFSDWHKTPVAAYFSHYEPMTPYKKFWWESAQRSVDIKTITADQYGAMLPGRIIKVTPPVDPEFYPRKRKPNEIPRVGVSGFVDRSGRKGEKLVARLAGDLEDKAIVVASGVGWP